MIPATGGSKWSLKTGRCQFSF